MDRGFPNIFWVRTPSGQELEHFDADPNKRSMMCWYSTVLPCLRALHEQKGSSEAFVLEDTFVCDVDVTFETIYRETHHRGAGVFGYAGYQQNRDGNTAWCGSKGFYLTHAWWEDMTIVLENSSLADFNHWDMWLVQRQRTGVQPEFKCSTTNDVRNTALERHTLVHVQGNG